MYLRRKVGLLNLSYNRLLTIASIISAAYLLAVLFQLIIVALFSGTYIQTYAADGTFQLYNPMRRLLDGQVIGRDFPFFHGVGVPLLHYPFFVLLGHNLFAAETVKWLVTPILFIVTSVGFFGAFFRSIQKTLISTAVFTLFALQWIEIVWPGNSLVGVRTTLPVLAGVFMLWKPKLSIRIRSFQFSIFKLVLFTLLASAVALGTEQGIAAIASYTLLEAYRNFKRREAIKSWAFSYARDVFSIGLLVVIVLSAMTKGNAIAALRYALIDVPADQGWYYGAPPNEYLSLSGLTLLFDRHFLPMAVGMLLGLIVVYIASKYNYINKNQKYVALFYILYGLIVFLVGTTGYFAPSAQLIPLYRVLSLFTVAIIITYLLSSLEKKKAFSKIIARQGLFIVFAITFLLATIITLKDTSRFQIINILKLAKNARVIESDTNSLSAEWKRRIESFEPYLSNDSVIWSTYTSVYDSTHAQLNPSSGGEDYIIHALGEKRRSLYENDFLRKKPTYVITLKPTYFRYEEWLWIRHWNMYRQLFQDYEIVADNDAHILWRYKPIQQEAAKPKPLQIRDGEIKLDFPKSENIRLYEVNLSYKVEDPVPMLNKFPRYMIRINDSEIQRFDVSLPPYKTTWSFPVAVAPGQTSITLRPYTAGISLGSSFTVHSANIKQITFHGDNGYILYDSYCSFGGKLDFDDMHQMMRCELKDITLEHFRQNMPSSLFTVRAENKGKIH